MATRDCSIVLRANKHSYRITKLVQYQDSGFGVFVPDDPFDTGFLLKSTVDYRARTSRVSFGPGAVRFSTSRMVKLSYHADGFVQFSGHNGSIRSGRNEDGSPKGLAIVTQPLSRPIARGPSVLLQVWGVDHHKEYQAKAADMSFGPDDIYKRRLSAAAGQRVTIIEIFVVPKSLAVPVCSFGDGQLRLVKYYPQFEGVGASFILRIAPFRVGNGNLLGVLVSEGELELPTETGFTLCGPSRIIRPHIGETLMAFYPNFLDADVESIDWPASTGIPE